ncbi:Rv1733c family protein [Gordonia sp. DT30]|uniref:Rv1733c family protein n=1 Tax=unclassified Gordonia (in: high G+C Gram-positive bacteria) TaxID=2657482 RepID=UPI003CF7EC24
MDDRTAYRRRDAYLPWSHNALMRRGDRMFATAAVISVALVLLAIPLCVWAGNATYRAVTARADDAIPISATVVHVTDPGATAVGTTATLAWRTSSGRHTDTMSVADGTKTGAVLDAWTTADGTRLHNHPGVTERVLGAVWVGGLTWLAVLTLVIIATGLVRRRVTRTHDALWDREWALAGKANGWAAR